MTPLAGGSKLNFSQIPPLAVAEGELARSVGGVHQIYRNG